MTITDLFQQMHVRDIHSNIQTDVIVHETVKCKKYPNYSVVNAVSEKQM